MKKNKLLFLIMIICFILSGCSARAVNNNIVGNISVYEQTNGEEDITYYRAIGNTMYLFIHVEDYSSSDPVINTTLYKADKETLIAKENKEGVFQSDVKVKVINKGADLKITEMVSYYDENDKGNNFSYTIVTKAPLTRNRLVASNHQQDMQWKIIDNIKGFHQSLNVGIYDGKLITYFYNYGLTFMTLLFFIINIVYIIKFKSLRYYDNQLVWGIDFAIFITSCIMLYNDVLEHDISIKMFLNIVLLLRIIILHRIRNK